MSTLLIVTVGGSPEPIIHAIEQNLPDFIYFICSTGQGPAASDVTITQETQFTRRGHCPHCDKKFEETIKTLPISERAHLNDDQYEIVRINNPDNLGEILEACQHIEEQITQRPHSRIIANYTGGTKTMSLALGLFALQRVPDWEVQVNVTVEGRTNIVKVESGDIAQPLDITTYLMQDIEKELNDLEEKMDYEGAIERINWVLTRFNLSLPLKQRLDSQRTRFQILVAWDRFEYQNALEIAKGFEPAKTEYLPRLKEIKRTLDLLDENNQEPWKPETLTGYVLVEDIIQNAQRCAHRFQFDDASSRLYRATELLAQLRLRKQFGLHSSAIDPMNPTIPEASRDWIKKYQEGNNPAKLALFGSFRLLYELNDPLGHYWQKNQNALMDYLNIRNYSFLAHGFLPINKDQWRNRGMPWIQWIKDAMASC